MSFVSLRKRCKNQNEEKKPNLVNREEKHSEGVARLQSHRLNKMYLEGLSKISEKEHSPMNMHVHTHTRTHMYTHVHTHPYTCMHTHAHVQCRYVRAHTHTRT